jgi:NAD(P)-dependent dehydrogenase (short-subunit alcohol dehydrogenase family)
VDLAKCSALVNGGAGGLGGAAARRLVELGVGVVLFDPDGERARQLADALGDRAAAVAGDQVVDADVEAAIAAAGKLGAFSICVNAAGALLTTPPTADAEGRPHEMALFEAMVRMHLFGPFNVARLSAAAFAKNAPDADGQRGVIINTASTAAFEGQARQAAYAASKGAIRSMTPALARDLAPIGVRACAIAPGPIMTPRLASAPPALIAQLVEDVAFPKRPGKPEEFGLLVEAIVRNPFLNGQVIRLDGAMSTRLASIGGAAK